MNNRQQRTLQCARRTIDWCAEHPGLVPPAVGDPSAWQPITRQYSALTAIVSTLEDAAADQYLMASRSTLEAASEPQLRHALRNELRATTQVAQALRKQVPGISVLRMPAPQIASEAYIKRADALRREASTFEQVLVEHGRPTDFIARLQNRTAALRDSINSRGSARAKQVQATKQILESLGQAMRYVNIMDAFITSMLHETPAELAGWKNARRITQRAASSSSASGDASIVGSVKGDALENVKAA